MNKILQLKHVNKFRAYNTTCKSYISDSLNYKGTDFSHTYYQSVMRFKLETTDLQVKVNYCWTRPDWQRYKLTQMKFLKIFTIK